MDIEKEVIQLIGQPESAALEYKAVLPPSKNIAQLISAFANTDGGYIVLGVSDGMEINGLSDDFHATTITHKAIDHLIPQPKVYYQYIIYKSKKLYVIKVEKSHEPIAVEGKIYKRFGASVRELNPIELHFNKSGFEKIRTINETLNVNKQNATNSLIKLIEHFQSILKIIDDLARILYPENPQIPTLIQEGKILSRILFSSFVDNFETYLSDLLYE